MRLLNPIEHSFTLINNFYPFVATCVLRIRKGPEVDALRYSLNRLQELNPLLNTVIKEKEKRIWFVTDNELGAIPLNIIKRKDNNHWEDLVRYDLNKGFNSGGCPLMRVNYLFSSGDTENAEIIMSFHHSLVDASLIMHLADQLLTIASENVYRNNARKEFSPAPVAPDFVNLLPASFKGIRLIYKIIPFIYRQLKDDLKYKRTNKGVLDAMIPSGSENDILDLSLSREETASLVKWSRKNRVSLNSILSAAMLIIVNQQNYNSTKKLLRALQFGNLRPYLKPSLQDDVGGCFIAMLRNTVPMQPETNVLNIAKLIDQQSVISAKRGDKFAFALMSPFLIKKTIKANNERLGAVALSYAGSIKIKQQYGEIQVTDIHGHITNNCLGAELTGFAKIFAEKLSIDLNFLTTETNREKALKVRNELKHLILRSIELYES